MYFKYSLIIIFIYGSSAIARSSMFCQEFFGRRSFLIREIPNKNSADYKLYKTQFVQTLTDPSRSHTIIDFESFFEKGYADYFYQLFQETHGSKVESQAQGYHRELHRFMLDSSDKVPEDVVQVMNFVFELIKDSIRDISSHRLSEMSLIEFRLYSKQEGHHTKEHWHLDGSAWNGIFHFLGPGTEYATGAKWSSQFYLKEVRGIPYDVNIQLPLEGIQSLKPFQFLFFRGMGLGNINDFNSLIRGQSLVHRATGSYQDRLFAVMRFHDHMGEN